MTSVVAGFLRGMLVGGMAFFMGAFVITWTTGLRFPDPVPAAMGALVFICIVVFGWDDDERARDE